jgi:hypothetical protein
MKKPLRPSEQRKQDLREAAEADLEVFIELLHPQRLLGNIHREVIRWWTRPEAKSHQLLLLPRDHAKSAMAAYRAAWEITRKPICRILYISSTSNLASKQLKFIKDILTSERYRYYWPEMVHQEESKREKWTETEISVDHPARREEAVRDPTVFTAGLTTNIVGLHCDIAIMDDVVTGDNAYTQEGRDRVQTQYSLLSSIEGAGAKEIVVGTRYHPRDLYNDMLEMNVDQYDEFGEIVGHDPLYEIMERQVESIGDGTGEFLWPRSQRQDGTWFGFNREVLATKRAQYLDRVQFRAQYYNNPNDPAGAGIQRDSFQYYEREHLSRKDGKWTYRGHRLNVFAAIDFAFSLTAKADYSCVVVVGVDANQNFYVLDIDRFKTNEISEYFKHILSSHQKWDFRKIIAETTVAQEVIVKNIRDSYIRPHGLALVVEPFKPHKYLGSKEERIAAILQPRYANLQVWHYQDGLCQLLEEELTLNNPPHDDIKDTLATAIDFSIAPSGLKIMERSNRHALGQPQVHSRFGGLN